MKKPIFANLLAHVWTDGHRNSNIIWHNGGYEIPERCYFPTTKICVPRELNADAIYMVKEIKMGHILFRTIQNAKQTKSSKSSAEVYHDLFK
jgi:hypothetical protein